MTYFSSNFLLSIFITSFFMATIVVARPLSTKQTLAARLKLDDEEGSSACWDSLYRLQSCTGEVILFFLNGETYLGPSCCKAIRTIGHDCWPNMLGSLGFTSEEGDVLRGYCDASVSNPTPQPHSPPHTVNSTTNVLHIRVL